MSPATISKALAKETIDKAKVSKMLNFAITDAELAALQLAKSTAKAQLTEYNSLIADDKTATRKPSIAQALHKSITQLIDQRSITGWTSSGHTGIDVPVFAFGQGNEHFQGLIDNTEIAEKIFYLLGKK